MLTSLHALIWAWIGAIIMFTLTVSPTVFATLEGPQASAFLRAYFPRLFRYEIAVGPDGNLVSKQPRKVGP